MKTVLVVLIITILYMSLSVDAQCYCRFHQCLDSEEETDICPGVYDDKPYCCPKNRQAPPPTPAAPPRCGCRFHQCRSNEVQRGTCEGLWDSKPHCCPTRS